MINIKTKNASFINMWRYLQNENIKNNDFMLRLRDPSLLDYKWRRYDKGDVLNNLEDSVKTMDDLRSDDYKRSISEEISENIWFFFREILCRKDDLASGKTKTSEYPIDYFYKHYTLNPATMKMIYLYEHKRNFIVDASIPGALETYCILLTYGKYYRNIHINSKFYKGSIRSLRADDSNVKDIVFKNLSKYKNFSEVYMKYELLDNIVGYIQKKYLVDKEKNIFNFTFIDDDTDRSTIGAINQDLIFHYQYYEPLKDDKIKKRELQDTREYMIINTPTSPQFNCNGEELEMYTAWREKVFIHADNKIYDELSDDDKCYIITE